MILNRTQFVEYLHKRYPNSSADFGDDSYLWIPEKQIIKGKQAKYFVVGRRTPVNLDDYWIDITINCSGIVRCYVSSEEGEWWGFTNKKDAFYFLLRWA